MKNYKITEAQKNEILSILLEIPLKYSAALHNFFTNLTPIEEVDKPIKSE